MSNQFFTEIPVRQEFNREKLREFFLTWVQGIGHSSLKIPDLKSRLNFDGETEATSDAGERIRLASEVNGDLICSGLQHDLPDQDGRVWRTEAVLTHSNTGCYLTLKTVCISKDLAINARTPKRPVLVKQIIDYAHGGCDGLFQVSDSPHYISDDELDLAARAVLGQATRFLPVVYVSSNHDNTLPLDVSELAYALGGLAHVVVEPDRNFSFLLRDETEAANPYAGAVGIGFPGKPVSMTLFPKGSEVAFRHRLAEIIQSSFLGKIASSGKEWADLTQMAIRSARERLQTGDGEEPVQEWIDNFESEISEKEQRITELKNEIAALTSQLAARTSETGLLSSLEEIKASCGELYPGELLDRLRNGIASGSNNNFSTSKRDKYVLDCMFELLQQSPQSTKLTARLQEASNNDNTHEVIDEVFLKLGYSKAGKKHIKYSPPQGVPGLTGITIGKTPSDNRFGQNAVRDAKDALGLRFPK